METTKLRGQIGLISIIIPTYNSIKWVSRAIDSALNQTYKPLEVIVVDDGSTDNTYEYLNSRYPDITIVKKPNGGASSAKNFGAAISKGEFLTFLDADDFMVPNKIELQLNVIKAFPDWGLCGTDAWVVFTEKENNTVDCNQKDADIEVSIIDFFTLLQGNHLIASSVIVKRESFYKVGCFDESLRWAEDYDLWLRIGENLKVLLLKNKLMGYQVTPGSLSDNKIAMKKAELKILQKWQDKYPKIVLPVIHRIILSITRKLLRAGQNEAAKEMFWESYSNKKVNWFMKTKYAFLKITCKIHSLYFSNHRNK